jgi:hypothetical protein
MNNTGRPVTNSIIMYGMRNAPAHIHEIVQLHTRTAAINVTYVWESKHIAHADGEAETRENEV